MTDLNEYHVALRIAAALEDLGIEYTLGGSLASSLHGEPRSTNDVDFAVRIGEHEVDPLAQRLGPEFAVDADRFREAIRQGRSYQVFFLPTVLKIDFFVRGAAAFDQSEFTRRLRVRLEGGSLYAATPEDSLLRKLVWFREGGEVSDRQWRDVLGIVRVSGAGLDRVYLKRWAGLLGVSDLLERAFSRSTGPGGPTA